MLIVKMPHLIVNLLKLAYFLFSKVEESIAGMFGFITLNLTFGSELPP